MTAAERLKSVIESRGTTYAFLSTRTKIPAGLLSRCFLGKRKLSADEFLAICAALDIGLGEFDSISNP